MLRVRLSNSVSVGGMLSVLGALNLVLAAPASPSIDFSSKTWTLGGSVKTSVRKVGSFGTAGELTAAFDESSFTLVDPENDTLVGSYQVGAKSTTLLAPGGESLNAYLTSKLVKIAAAEAVELVISSIEVTSVSATAKASSVPTGIGLNLSVKIQATANVTVGGEALSVKFSSKLSGKGVLNTSIAGTSWAVPFASRLSVKKLGKVTEADSLLLQFGPGDGLAEEEFLLTTEGGVSLRGTFGTDGRQNVTLTLSAAVVEELLAGLIEDAGSGIVSNVSTSLTQAKATGKVKHGLSITLKINFRFSAAGDAEGERVSSTGTYSLKGTGVLD